jgi:2-polyprenyl-3-methyl-5-hydroxy-6-metoxy-1,4-benzoquinol methylase
MNKISVRGCPICESKACEFLRYQKFVLPEGHPLSQGYDVVYCQDCGFVFADTAVTQADYDAFYAQFSKYEDQQTSTGGGESPSDAERLIEMAEYIAKHVSDRKARILDLGCANGGLLKALKAMGYTNLLGVDPSPTCVRTTKSLGVEASEGSLFSFPTQLGKFDVVILSHVLEHVQAVRQAIDLLTQITATGGLVYIEVPDATRYAEMVAAPFQDFNTEHINHFSPHSLAQLLRLSGWDVKAEGGKTVMSAPNMPYPAIYLLARKSQISRQAEVVVKDVNLKETILTYIARSQMLMDKIEARLQQTLRTSPEIIVWGTGQLALKLLAETSLGKARIAAFVDGNPINHGKVLCGSPILPPEKIRGMPQPIIITSMLHQAAIATTIRDKMGLTNPIVMLQ